MTNTINLNIISPQSVIYNQNITSMVCTAEDGKLGVLPGHADMFASLKPSDVEIKDEQGAELKFPISGGLLEVHPDKIIIYTE